MRPWSADAGLQGPFSGTVESIEAFGRETFVGVRAGDELEFIVRFDGAASHPLGRLEFGIERDRAMLFDPESEAAIGRQGGAGWNQRCAIAVGTIAERTTTASSSENCVRSMIPAFSP